MRGQLGSWGLLMNETAILLSAVLAPTLGAVVLPFIGLVSPKARNLCAALLVLVALICSSLLLPSVLAGKTTETTLFGLRLAADALAVFMAASASLLSFIIVLYSFGYVDHYEHQNEYYSMVVLFLGSMMGLVYSGDLVLLFIFWELTAIASWRLIGFFREPEYVKKADKAFLITVFGALLMLVGFLWIYGETGTFDLVQIREKLGTTPISNLALVLILCGIFSKSATLPFHTWLPDAGVAPSPVTALLHAAVLVKIGVYVFARLFIGTFAYSEFGHTLVLSIAATSALVSGGAALVDTNIKRIIAYSTISQIGFIFLGFAAGNDIGITGALLYILMHGLGKAGLFLSAGIIEHGTHTKDVTKMGGLLKSMPITGVSFLLCALSVMGVPPLGGFFSKLMVMTGAVQAGQLWISGLFLLGAFLTIIYLFRLFNLVFLGEPRGKTPHEGTPIMVYSVAALAVLSVLGGIVINWPSLLAEFSAHQLLGMVK